MVNSSAEIFLFIEIDGMFGYVSGSRRILVASVEAWWKILTVVAGAAVAVACASVKLLCNTQVIVRLAAVLV